MRERKGRMINKDISNSNRFAKLSPEAAVLFAMLIPHYNSHGKMNGGPGYIKDEICPKVPYLNSKTIPRLLLEISENTNVKWFLHDGRYWIHSINFLSDHQDLDPKRLGKDLIPDYSETCQVQVLPEVEVEVKEKEKEKEKKVKSIVDKTPKPRFSTPSIKEINDYCVQRNNKVDPQKFFDYYESNGWRVGKNPMKSWQAAIRTWEKNNYGGNGNGPTRDLRSFHDRAVEQNEKSKLVARAVLRGISGRGNGLGSKTDKGPINPERENSIDGEFERIPEVEADNT